MEPIINSNVMNLMNNKYLERVITIVLRPVKLNSSEMKSSFTSQKNSFPRKFTNQLIHEESSSEPLKSLQRLKVIESESIIQKTLKKFDKKFGKFGTPAFSLSSN